MDNFQKLLGAALLAIFLIFTGCKDKEGDETSPLIITYKPIDGDTLKNFVEISANISDYALKRYTVILSRKSDGTVFFIEEQTFGNSFDQPIEFNRVVYPSGLASPAALTLKFFAEDHSGNSVEKTVELTFVP